MFACPPVSGPSGRPCFPAVPGAAAGTVHERVRVDSRSRVPWRTPGQTAGAYGGSVCDCPRSRPAVSSGHAASRPAALPERPRSSTALPRWVWPGFRRASLGDIVAVAGTPSAHAGALCVPGRCPLRPGPVPTASRPVPAASRARAARSRTFCECRVKLLKAVVGRVVGRGVRDFPMPSESRLT